MFILADWLMFFFRKVLIDKINVYDCFNLSVRQFMVPLIICFFLNVLGKILNDDTALKEYKIDEKNFVVVMVTKVSFSLLCISLSMGI